MECDVTRCLSVDIQLFTETKTLVVSTCFCSSCVVSSKFTEVVQQPLETRHWTDSENFSTLQANFLLASEQIWVPSIFSFQRGGNYDISHDFDMNLPINSVFFLFQYVFIVYSSFYLKNPPYSMAALIKGTGHRIFDHQLSFDLKKHFQ